MILVERFSAAIMPQRDARICQIPGKGQASRPRFSLAWTGYRLIPLLILCLLTLRPAWSQEIVDLELVLAVDASGSVDEAEFRLQMDGIAYALRDPAVIEAIARGPAGRIAVNVAIWAQSEMPKDSIGWHLIADAAGAEALAQKVARHPRRVIGGTGIGRAILYAVRLFENSGYSGTRQVIDLSGDGRETTFRTWSVPPSQARFAARAARITINGLAILTDEPDLGRYYRNEVITGPDSFVMETNSFLDFSKAMKEKLLREIEYRPKIGGPIDSPVERTASIRGQRLPPPPRKP